MVRGLEELARKQFNLPVRMGKPLGVQGLTDVVASPTHATAVGLVRHAASNHANAPVARPGLLRVPRKSTSKAPPRERPEKTDDLTNGLWERIKGMFKNFF